MPVSDAEVAVFLQDLADSGLCWPPGTTTAHKVQWAQDYLDRYHHYLRCHSVTHRPLKPDDAEALLAMMRHVLLGAAAQGMTLRYWVEQSTTREGDPDTGLWQLRSDGPTRLVLELVPR